jgi:putative two-component system response regulator
MLTDKSFRVIVDAESDSSAPIAQNGIKLLRSTGQLVDMSQTARLSQKRSRILIVDDEESVRKLLGTHLSEHYDCDFAQDGPEALAMLTSTHYDLAMVDVVLPKLSGISLLKQIRVEAPAVVVVLMTGVQDSRLGIEAIRRGAFDFISKPFGLDEVEMSVQRGLRHKEILDETEFYQNRLQALVVERTSSLQAENERLQSDLLEMTLSFRAILAELTAALETRDFEARGHTERVVAYAMRLGKQLGLDYDSMIALEHGSLLHDIGTIFIPEHILRKPGRLTEQEWSYVKKHTELGAKMIARCGMLADAAPIVEQHHEHWDGSGYPCGLRGDAIDLRARIFAVADCLDAMLSERPYSAARTISEAAAELLRCKGKQFDPAVVDAFFDVPLEEWNQIRSCPIGQAVSVTGPLDSRLVAQIA